MSTANQMIQSLLNSDPVRSVVAARRLAPQRRTAWTARAHEPHPGIIRGAGRRDRDPAGAVGHRRQRRQRQYARLRRGSRQSGRALDGRHSPASASTRPASTAISTPCCKASCGLKRLAAPTRTRRRNLPAAAANLRNARVVELVRQDLQQLHHRAAGAVEQPESYSAQTQVVGAAQTLAQNLNGMTGTIQQLRTQAEQGIATDVQTANNAMQQIARSTSSGSSAAGQRDRHAARPARPGHHPAQADEYQGGTGHEQPGFGLHRQRPTARVGVNPSTAYIRQRGTLTPPRCGTPIRAKTKRGPSRSRRRAAHRSIWSPKTPFIGRDRRLPADARHDSAAGAELSSTSWQTRCRNRCRTRRRAEDVYVRRAVRFSVDVAGVLPGNTHADHLYRFR